MYLFDTNICIHILNHRDRELLKKLKGFNPRDISLCSIVKAELLFGARNSQKVNHNLSLLESFFAQFQSFDFNDQAANYYGIIRTLLTQSGKLIGPNDLIIASIALANDLTLITRNMREFARVPGLKCQTW